MPITFAVLLWPVEGREADLAAYEDDVLALMPGHGGRVVQRVRRLDAADRSQPLETHILQFEDERAFDAYVADPRRAQMAERRQACIARTEIWRVEHVT